MTTETTLDLQSEPTALPLDVLEVTFTVNLPKHVRLTVQRDTRGRLWPGLGLNITRILRAHDLIHAGCYVEWVMENGEPLNAELALNLIDQRQRELDDGGDAPEFVLAANDGANA